jgi:hypothetical protein
MLVDFASYWGEASICHLTDISPTSQLQPHTTAYPLSTPTGLHFPPLVYLESRQWPGPSQMKS